MYVYCDNGFGNKVAYLDRDENGSMLTWYDENDVELGYMAITEAQAAMLLKKRVKADFVTAEVFDQAKLESMLSCLDEDSHSSWLIKDELNEVTMVTTKVHTIRSTN